MSNNINTRTNKNKNTEIIYATVKDPFQPHSLLPACTFSSHAMHVFPNPASSLTVRMHNACPYCPHAHHALLLACKAPVSSFSKYLGFGLWVLIERRGLTLLPPIQRILVLKDCKQEFIQQFLCQLPVGIIGWKMLPLDQAFFNKLAPCLSKCVSKIV